MLFNCWIDPNHKFYNFCQTLICSFKDALSKTAYPND